MTRLCFLVVSVVLCLLTAACNGGSEDPPDNTPDAGCVTNCVPLTCVERGDCPEPTKGDRAISLEIENRASNDRSCSLGYTLPGVNPVRLFGGVLRPGERKSFRNVIVQPNDFQITLNAECDGKDGSVLHTISTIGTCLFTVSDSGTILEHCYPGAPESQSAGCQAGTGPAYLSVSNGGASSISVPVTLTSGGTVVFSETFAIPPTANIGNSAAACLPVGSSVTFTARGPTTHTLTSDVGTRGVQCFAYFNVCREDDASCQSNFKSGCAPAN